MIPRRNLCLLTLAMLAAACGTTTHQTRYMHASADLGAIKSVAVLPFDSLAQDRTSGDKVQKIFYLELLSLGVFDVAEPGQVTKLIRGSGAAADTTGPADYQKTGKELGADAL